MHRRLGIALWAVAGLAVAAAPVWAAAPTQQELEALAKELEAEAEAYFAGDPTESELTERLKALTYDEKSPLAIAAALRAPRKPPIGLYVANKLFHPLLLAKTEVIRKALPVLKQAHSRYGRYQPLPKYSELALRQYEYPAFDPRVDAEGLLKRISIVDERRRERQEKEDQVRLYNEQVCDLEKTLFRLMVLADQPNEDRSLVLLMADLERKGQWNYADALAAITAQAAKMPQQRAASYYNPLLRLGSPLRYVKRKYRDYTSMKAEHGKNSTFTEQDDYPGVRLLSAVNALANQAKLPAVKAPTTKDVEEKIKADKKKQEAAKKKDDKKRGGR